jgi:uncharacterized protein YjlB
VIIVPAGVDHRLLGDFNSGFEMVGNYPKGKQWDMCYGKKGKESKVRGIAELGWFEKDPYMVMKGLYCKMKHEMRKIDEGNEC